MSRLLTRVAGPPSHPVYVRLSPIGARLLWQSCAPLLSCRQPALVLGYTCFILCCRAQPREALTVERETKLRKRRRLARLAVDANANA